MQSLYRHRDWVATLPAAGLVLFLVTAGLREIKPLIPKEETPVKLEIIDMAQLEPPKPIVPPAPPAPPEPVRREPTPPKPMPPRPQTPPRPATPAPATSTSAPAPTPPSSTPAPSAVAAPVAPVTPAPSAPPAPAAPRVNADAEFIGRVRSYLNSVKRYPTGREASLQRPQGTVKVWFVLKRDGSVVEMGVEESSNSILLDQAARKSVSLGNFPAFPEQFRPGQSQHRFVVDLQFTPASS